MNTLFRNTVKSYRICSWLRANKLDTIAKVIERLYFYLYNCYIPSSCKIGKDSILAYGGIGIVIHKNAIIGRHCMIGQNVTIGTKDESCVTPVIEDNVYIGPGARILGGITIGHDSIIGANSVVIRNVPPYSVVGGIPAKVLSTITKENYYEKYQHYYGPSLPK